MLLTKTYRFLWTTKYAKAPGASAHPIALFGASTLYNLNNYIAHSLKAEDAKNSTNANYIRNVHIEHNAIKV